MKKVGLIVNPFSGTDLRRINGITSFFDNYQKVYITASILNGLQFSGIDEVLALPDYYRIAETASEEVKGIKNKLSFINMKITNTSSDTSEAVRSMVSEGVCSIVILGGDGTVNVASTQSGNVPLVPVSTGTNNVIPFRVDGTVAGLVAGFASEINEAVVKMKRIEVFIESELRGYALVEAGLTTHDFIGAKALLSVKNVKGIFVTMTKPGNIGLASVAGLHGSIGYDDDMGIFYRLGTSGFERAIITMPGLIEWVKVTEEIEIGIGKEVKCESAKMVEIDGEREIPVYNEEVVLRLTRNGPFIIDLIKALKEIDKLIAQSKLYR